MDHRPHPLEGPWQRLRREIEDAPPADRTGLSAGAYLDVAERIVRAAALWQDPMGVVVDPYQECEAATGTARFVGALGQLVAAGRCGDLVDVLVRSYENALGTIKQPRTAPEFAVKELLLAHAALRDKVAPERLRKWEAFWRGYNARASYHVTFSQGDHNFNTFGLVGEFLRIRAGLGGDMDFVNRLLERELGHVDEYGMYHDPGCPMTYHVVVVQQLGMLLMAGYDGPHAAPVREAVRRGGLSSLLMQSCVGQAPFGGRSNQYHHMEAQSAALFEVCARLARDDGNVVLAGAFKGAARRGIALVRPWIFDMEPFRHLKQGFHPKLDHGTDSGGLYSVYGILTASLCGIAHGYADETIPERVTPARVGGYVFSVAPDFAKVFAACGGWSLQIDTRADLGRDATGLGRVQKIGLRPEGILSGSISGRPAYTSAFDLPQRNVAIGPEWDAADGSIHRLADFSEQLDDAELVIHHADGPRVAFDVVYRGDLAGVSQIRERYELTSGGLIYSAELDPAPPRVRYTVPVIETDGNASSTADRAESSLTVAYRGGTFAIEIEGGTVCLTDERNANRNGVYRTAVATPAGPRRMVLRIR